MSTRSEDLQWQMQRDLQESEQNIMEPHPLLQTVVSGASGILFGIALEKGRVFEPQVIVDQMLFRRFVMLKMFLSASLVGMVSISFLKLIPQTERRMEMALQNFAQCLQFKSVSGVAVGAAILGIGMTISGACPGTVLVQLGALVPNAWATVAGGLAGAVLYSLTESSLDEVFRRRTKYKNYFLDEYLGVPYMTLAIPMASVMAVVVLGLEFYFPWFTEVPSTLVNWGVMKAGAWPPFVTGLIIGTLQIPMVLVNRDTLGSSTSYMTIASQFFPFYKDSPGDSHMKKYRYGMNNWWQVVYIAGAVAGAFISSSTSGTIGTVAGLSWQKGFGGGLLIIFGSRLAAGCTSGHGLSGMGLLALLSFVAVPAMFGGGIVTAFFMKNVLNLDI